MRKLSGYSGSWFLQKGRKQIMNRRIEHGIIFGKLRANGGREKAE